MGNALHKPGTLAKDRPPEMKHCGSGGGSSGELGSSESCYREREMSIKCQSNVSGEYPGEDLQTPKATIHMSRRSLENEGGPSACDAGTKKKIDPEMLACLKYMGDDNSYDEITPHDSPPTRVQNFTLDLPQFNEFIQDEGFLSAAVADIFGGTESPIPNN